MALLAPVPGSSISQGYGKDKITVEPTMAFSTQRAAWQPFPGSVWNANVHGAIDYAAPAGAQIIAAEAGTVTFAGWKDGGGGNCVFVQIRPNVTYTNSHMKGIAVKVGQKVARSQVLGWVGATGIAFGNHNHFQMTMYEKDSNGVWHTFYYNPALFLPGGTLANDPRITPLATVYTKASFNSGGINIRTSPTISDASFWGKTTDKQVVRRDGTVVASDPTSVKNLSFTFGGWVTGDAYDGGNTWGKLYVGGAYRFAAKPFITPHF